MKSREEILKILRRELPYLREKYHVKRIGIFGSYAREEEGRSSDVDVLVEFEKPVTFIEFMKLEFYLEDRFGVKVDLVTQDALKPLIRPRVMEDLVYA